MDRIAAGFGKKVGPVIRFGAEVSSIRNVEQGVAPAARQRPVLPASSRSARRPAYRYAALPWLRRAALSIAAEQMASGALHASGAELAAAITGIAGPTGGTPAKPVGLVWIAVALRAPGGRIESQAEEHRFGGDRDAIRRASVSAALRLLVRAAGSPGAGREPTG